MSITRIIGLVLLAVGVTLLIFGYNASQSVSEKIVEGFMRERVRAPVGPSVQ